jgi:DNA-binding beta-propeller fold protein YncE
MVHGGRVTRRLLVCCLLLAAGTVMSSCGDPHPQEKIPMSQVTYAGKVNAPDFPVDLEWLNTNRPFSLKDLRGKVVLLDFWTFCCINCIHSIPELKKLEEKYSPELVVIGVHSAKFSTEKGTSNIREAILRYGIEHPVVNDKDFRVWKSYAVNAWPTFMLIDPDGKVVGSHAGEGVYDLFDEIIGKMIGEFESRGKIDRRPLKFALEKDRAPRTLLSFPGKIAADAKGTTLYITDSNNNRIILLSPRSGEVLRVIGSGKKGLQDGTLEEAEFNKPQGIAWDHDMLYVADTENHAVRVVDLKKGTVKTLAGTGRQARESNLGGVGRGVDLNSPWDLLVRKGTLYIAMAGAHELWTLDLTTLKVRPFAGSGREDIVDAPLRKAALAQPSGITTDGTRLYFADSEVSGVRSADFDTAGSVTTIVGQGLFEFGDVDGIGPDVRLQHPIGITWYDGFLYVADTYNNKVKRIDPRTMNSETIIGTGGTGMRDGDALQTQLNEPNGLAVVKGKLYITDTNNHLIRVYDFSTRRVSTLTLRGAEKLAVRKSDASTLAVDDTLILPGQIVQPGPGSVEVTLTFPSGYKANTVAPFYFGVFGENGRALGFAKGYEEQNLVAPSFPVRIPSTFTEGASDLRIDLVAYYCREGEESLCMVRQVRVLMPVKVAAGDAGNVLKVAVPLRLASH